MVNKIVIRLINMNYIIRNNKNNIHTISYQCLKTLQYNYIKYMY